MVGTPFFYVLLADTKKIGSPPMAGSLLLYAAYRLIS